MNSAVQGDLPILVKATCGCYARAARQALAAMRGAPLLVILLLIVWVPYVLLQGLLRGLFGQSMALGFAMGLLETLVASIVLSAIGHLATNHKSTLRALLHFDGPVFIELITVSFVVLVPVQVLQQVGILSGFALLVAAIALQVVFSSVAESLLINRFDGIRTLGDAWGFTKESGAEWLIPIVFLTSIAQICLTSAFGGISAGEGLYFFATLPLGFGGLFLGSLLLPPLSFLQGRLFVSMQLGLQSGQTPSLLLSIGALALALWLVFFRYHLYRELSGSTRRKRIYQYRTGGK